MHEEKWGKWEVADDSKILLRGKTYLDDFIKIPSQGYMFEVKHVEMFASYGDQVDNIAEHPDSYVSKMRKEGNEQFMFVVNIKLPGEPRYNLVMYYADRIDKSSMDVSKEAFMAFHTCLDRFIQGDDEYKQQVFKFIPTCVAGGVIVENVIGSRPVILGNKLDQSYVHNETMKFLEIDVDIESSTVACGILVVCKQYSDWLVIDLNFLLEGHDEEELPEVLLGGVRLYDVRLDLVETCSKSSEAPPIVEGEEIVNEQGEEEESWMTTWW